MTNEQNSKPCGSEYDGAIRRQTVAQFIEGIMRFGCEVREAQMYECDSHDIHDEAQAFSEWVDQRSLDLEAPAEWLAAWELYVSDDDEEYTCDEPPNIDDDAGYDPYSGGPERDIDDCFYDDDGGFS